MDVDANAPDRVLRAGLAGLRRRWFAVVWSRVAAWWALGGAAVLAAFAVTVGITGARGGVLIALAGAAALVWLAAFGALAWPWRRRPSDRQVARYAEEHVPDLEERLLSAVGVLERPAHEWTAVQRLVVAEGARALGALDRDRVVSRRAVGRGVALAGAAFGVLLLAVAGTRGPVERAWTTARLWLWPATVALVVEPGHAVVVEGGELALRVRVEGVDADAWDAPIELRSASAHLGGTLTLERTGDAWAAQVPAGDAAFFYRVASGPLVSPEFHVDVRRRPRVDRIALHYEFPGFSGLAPRVEEDGGDVFAPAGTRVTVRVHTRDAIDEGALALASGTAVPLARRDDRLLEGQFVVAREDAYRVRLRDPHGVSAEGDTEYFVRPMDDRPPEVRVIRPGGDSRVTRLEEVTVEARADDDHGVARLELVYAPRGGAERSVRLGGGGTSVTGQHTIYVEDLDVRPGDFVSYYVRARDVARGKRSSETRSDIFFLEVRPFNEEFEAAQTQAGAQGGDGSFDDLARLQKDVIVATWRLDRRRDAGRSAQDIRVVARSQAEVKARAERLAQQMAPRPAPMPRLQFPPLPPQPGPAPGPRPTPSPQTPPTPAAPPPDPPMRRAVEAMARAQQALDALDTAGALPHENEALNEILRAQAEVRRRQVARQQSSRGGRGGQSGNQDLSALFDRELQRQQQTNYEQRASAQPEATREARREDEQLRRLRELAARQDELGRQQQELARRRAQMSAEEVKRRLERLTREQEQLRQQAEALAQRLQQRAGGQPQDAGASRAGEAQGGEPQASPQAGAQGTPGAQQGGGAAGAPAAADAQRVRDAAREMARAAGDLQRQSPEQASARAASALDRLRAAERALAGESPDERRRRAGDLQAEARQIAEAQRRLAAEAGSGGATTDTLRRLADQQGRLAERADALERDAREAAARAPGDVAGQAVRRAARDLAGARVGERLRGAADAARQASDGPGDPAGAARDLAAAARAAAQPLDRAAERLAAASGQDADTRRLSDALSQTRGLRERLAELDRRAQGMDRAAASQGTPSGPGGREGATGRREAGNETASAQGSGRRDGQGQGTTGGTGEGGGASVAELQEQLQRDLRARPDVIDALRRDDRSLAQALSALEGWTPGRSAPGTEAWKQDFARWDVLKRQVALALERYETRVAERLAAREARDRLDAGADDRPGDEWTREVADYFRAIAARAPRR